MRRSDEMDRRLVLEMDEWDDRAEGADAVEGEMDRGVEMSELLEVLLCAYDDDAMARLKDAGSGSGNGSGSGKRGGGRGEKKKKGRRARKKTGV